MTIGDGATVRKLYQADCSQCGEIPGAEPTPHRVLAEFQAVQHNAERHTGDHFLAEAYRAKAREKGLLEEAA